MGRLASLSSTLAKNALTHAMEALKDKDAGVRCAVVQTMGQLMKAAPELQEKALPYVWDALKDERAVRRAAVVTLR